MIDLLVTIGLLFFLIQLLNLLIETPILFICLFLFIFFMVYFVYKIIKDTNLKAIEKEKESQKIKEDNVRRAEAQIRNYEKEIELQKEKEKKEKIQQEIILKENVKYNSKFFLYTYLYNELITNILNIPIFYKEILNINNNFEVVNYFIEEILKKLPKDYSLKNLMLVLSTPNALEIIKCVAIEKFSFSIDRYDSSSFLEELNKEFEVFNSNDNKIFEQYPEIVFSKKSFDMLINSKWKDIISMIKLLQGFIDKDKINLNNPKKYDVIKVKSVIEETKDKQKYMILYGYFYYAILICYFILINKEVEKIKNSDFYDVYKKLNKEKHNEDYIVENLYNIYESLYKDGYDIKYNNDNFKILITLIEESDKVIELENYIDQENSILNINVEEYAKIIEMNEISDTIYNDIAKNCVKYREYITLFDAIMYISDSQKVDTIIKKVKRVKAEIEKNKILNGSFEKEENKNSLLDISNIHSGYDFEEYIAQLYSLLGYTINELTSKSGDQGADIIISKDKIKYAVQVKYYSSTVGNKAIQEVVAAKNFYKTDKAMVVTNNLFTKQAKVLAKANDVILVDGIELEKLKKQII